MTVVAPPPPREAPAWRPDEFVCADASSNERLGGAAGGGVYMIDSRQHKVRVGIYAGSITREGDSRLVHLIVRPQGMSKGCTSPQMSGK